MGFFSSNIKTKLKISEILEEISIKFWILYEISSNFINRFICTKIFSLKWNVTFFFTTNTFTTFGICK